jgi:hypothetical protein
MRWCLSCHEHPEDALRPRSDEFLADDRPLPGQAALGRRLMAENHVRSLTDCVICHR